MRGERQWQSSPVVLALICVCAALYLPSLDNPLVWDDQVHIDRIAQAKAAEAFSRHADEDYRRPMVLLSYWLQQQLGFDSAGAYHAVNIVLHAANAVLLFFVLLELGIARMVAGAGALLFTVHPLQSAAVAYVSGRTDLLAAMFVFATVLAVLHSRRVHTPMARRLLFAVVAPLCALCAALSKEIGLAAPLLGAAACRVVVHDERESAFVPVALSMAVAGIVGVWLAMPPALVEGADLSAFTRFRAAGTALTAYAQLLAAPAHLHLDRMTATGGAMAAAIGALVTGLMLPGLLWFFRRPTPISFGLLALVLVYLPASGLVPVYPRIVERWVFTPEHFMYLPLAVLAPMAIAALVAVARRATERAGGSIGGLEAGSISAGLVLLSCALATALALSPVRTRQHDLSDPERLFRSIIEHSPSPRACFNLGVALLERSANSEAASVYERCVRLSPEDAGMYLQLGVARQLLGDTTAARAAYVRALQLTPDDPLVWTNIASLDASLGFYDDARRGWQTALEMRPGFEPALEGLTKLDALGRSTYGTPGAR